MKDERNTTWVFPARAGELRIVLPVPHVVRTTVVGHFSKDLIRPYTETIDRCIAQLGSPIEKFNDWEGLENYDSENRVEITNWAIKRRAMLRTVHVLARSKIVQVGLSIANIALGGFISVHGNRVSFEAAFKDATTIPRARQATLPDVRLERPTTGTEMRARENRR
jgi:hypothetical protein